MKRWLLDLAEVLDALRVVPRLLLVGASVYVPWYTTVVTQWYFSAYRDGAWPEGVFLTATLSALYGAYIKLCQWYLNSGRKWGQSRED